MIKLVVFGLVFVSLTEAAISSLQFLIPEDSYSVSPSAKPAINNLDNSIISLSEEDKSSKALSEESHESIASFSSSQSSFDAAGGSSGKLVAGTGASPAALARAKLPTALSAITSTSAISRGSLFISSSAQASTAANTPQSSSPVASVKSTATIQHRILPAETIPLPITISTRPGLRTVIAPETITIQQPVVARVGEVVQHIPTAVSHQRQTVVHNHARVVTPIVAPAVRTVSSQVVRAYHTPLLYSPHVVENQD